MQITRMGGGNRSFASATRTFTLNTPAGMLQGDTLVIQLARRHNASVTRPAGIIARPVTGLNPAGDRLVDVYVWRAQSGTPPPALAFSLSAPTTGSLTWEWLRGVDGKYPIASGVSTREHYEDALWLEAVTTGDDNTVQMAGVALGTASQTITPAAYHWHHSGTASSGINAVVATAREARPSPGFIPSGWLEDSPRAAAVNYVSWTFTLRPQLSWGDGPFPGGPIPATDVESLWNPFGRWSKPIHRPSWYHDGKWGAVVPTWEGHRVIPDLEYPLERGPLVDERNSSRIDTRRVGDIVHTLAGHYTNTWYRAYDAANDYALVHGPHLVPINVPDNDPSPIVLHVGEGGSLWVGAWAESAIRVTRSTNGGATWATPVTLASGYIGPTGLVGFGQSGDTIVLFATGNEGNGRHAWSIAEGASSLAVGNWTEEPLPAMHPEALSDDHLSVDADDQGRIWVATKTTVETPAPLLTLLRRDPGGYWGEWTIEIGPDNDTNFTRPCVAVYGDRVLVTYGKINIGNPRSLYIRELWADRPGAMSNREVLIEGDIGPWGYDSGLMARGADVQEAEVIPILAHDHGAGTLVLEWYTPGQVQIGEPGLRAVTGLTGQTMIEAAFVGEEPVALMMEGF